MNKSQWLKVSKFFDLSLSLGDNPTMGEIKEALPSHEEAVAYFNGLSDDSEVMQHFDLGLIKQVYPDWDDSVAVPTEVVVGSPPLDIDTNMVLGQLIIIDQIKIDKVPITLVIHEWEPNRVYAKSGLLDPGFGAPCTWQGWCKAKKDFNLQLALRMFGNKNVLPDFQVDEEATYREAAVLQKLKGRITTIISKEISTLGYYSNCFTPEIWEAIDLFRLKALSPDTDIAALAAKVDGTKMRHQAQALGGTSLLQQTTALQKAVKASLALR